MIGMIKTNKRSLVGYVIGFIWALGFFWRYFIIYGDYSQGIVFIALGLLLMAFSWIYEMITRHGNKIYAVEEYLADKDDT